MQDTQYQHKQQHFELMHGTLRSGGLQECRVPLLALNYSLVCSFWLPCRKPSMPIGNQQMQYMIAECTQTRIFSKCICVL
jgi:hypothetical protein